MKKLVKCKTCGGQVAKTAKVCPHCGAKQHQGAYAACVVIALIAFFACVAILMSGGDGESPTRETQSESSQASQTTDSVVFEGSSATVTYQGVSESPGVSGCFLLNLTIENTGEQEEVIYLSDVYVDDVSANTGTGMPVEVSPGKKANGAFIIFSETALSDIQTVEYKVTIANSETYNPIETSGTINLALSARNSSAEAENSSVVSDSNGLTLGAGTYTVGVDIEPGVYDCVAASGFGVLRGDLASMQPTGFVMTMGNASSSVGGYSASVEAAPSYNNLTLTDGDIFYIEMGLNVQFTKK
jgi:hypothetical protein